MGLVEWLTTPHCKKETVRNPLDKPRNWIALAEDRDQWYPPEMEGSCEYVE